MSSVIVMSLFKILHDIQLANLRKLRQISLLIAVSIQSRFVLKTKRINVLSVTIRRVLYGLVMGSHLTSCMKASNTCLFGKGCDFRSRE